MTAFSPTYLFYIRSDAWRKRRERALMLAGHRCQVCGDKKRLQVHHVSYVNLGHESDADLTVLCWWCHLFNTWQIRARRLWRWIWE